MYKSAQGLFGIPKVVCSYNVKGPDGKEHSTINYIPNDATFWDVFKRENRKDEIIKENRVHTRHVFETEGRDLLEASSPKELLEGILHGMIGESVVGFPFRRLICY